MSKSKSMVLTPRRQRFLAASEARLVRQVSDLTHQVKQLGNAVEAKNLAYLERNRVVAFLASLALANGWRAGIRSTSIEGWDPVWHNCCYIDLPTGQASWHYHDDHAPLFAHLPPYEGEWDGHSTFEKYQRLELQARLIIP